MKHRLFKIYVILQILFSNPVFGTGDYKPPKEVSQVCTAEMEITGVIGPATYDYLKRGMERATSWNCSSLLLLINTPGGSLQSTRLIVEEILASNIPVLCLISPSGGHAGSAGAIIMQACHVNGAVRATNIGAATPVSGIGKDMPKDLRKKMINDTVSWVRGLTRLRGRNEKFGEEIITEAKAVSAKKAFDIKAIDFLAKNKEDFLIFSQGQKVKGINDVEFLVEAPQYLRTINPGLRDKILDMVADPQLAYMMFMGSIGLLYFEITHPGMIVPGVVGGIGLVISLISMHKLEVEWGGLLLILLGVGFMIGEAFVPSFGMLGVGGTISFVVGSLFLFDSDSEHVIPKYIIFSTSLILGLISMGIAYLAFSTRNIKSLGAYNDVIGQLGLVKNIDPGGQKGQLHVLGETWNFKSKDKLDIEDEVKITGHKGLTLTVTKKH